MVHKFKMATEHPDWTIAICGRVIKPSRISRNMNDVDCLNCKAAFARILRELPDVVGAARTEGVLNTLTNVAGRATK
jgi:hypothetical protein